jgi:hypothetical protein
VSWGAEVRPGTEGERVLVRWGDFKATYRGREKGGTRPLRKEGAKRVGVMCRR